MRRKLTKHGVSLVVTIPAEWAKKYHLGKEDFLDVDIEGDKLIASIERTKAEKKKAVLKQSEMVPFEEKVVGKFYMAGYDVVEVFIDNPERIEWLKQRVGNYFPGFEVTEETSKKIVFTSLTADLEEQYREFEKKAFMSGLHAAEQLLEGLEKNNKTMIEEAKKIELSNTKSCTFCERYLNKRGAKNYGFTYVIIWGLEKAIDEYKYLADYVLKEKPALSKETLELLKKANQFLKGFYGIYYNFTMQTFSQLYKLHKDIMAAGYKLGTKSTGKEALAIGHILNIARITSDILSSLVGKQEFAGEK